MFNLGPQELIILGLVCVGPVFAGVIILAVVLIATNKGRRDD